MQQGRLAWIEFGIAVAGIAVAVWPLSRLCSGRPLGHDCESWFIFGVNLFAPLGVVSLVCAVWTARTRSRAPHFVIGATFSTLVARFVVYGLL